MKIEKINFEQNFKEFMTNMEKSAPKEIYKMLTSRSERRQKISYASNLVRDIYHSAMADFICEFWIPGLKLKLSSGEIISNVRREPNGYVWCDVNGKSSIVDLAEFTQVDLECIMTYLTYKKV